MLPLEKPPFMLYIISIAQLSFLSSLRSDGLWFTHSLLEDLVWFRGRMECPKLSNDVLFLLSSTMVLLVFFTRLSVMNRKRN